MALLRSSFHDSKLLHRDGVGQNRQTAVEEINVFISHSSTQREWVETLADNLQRAGKSVFLDLWRLVPGRDFIDGLRAGLAACRSSILVVSPEALQSGWVREEYEILKRRQAKDSAIHYRTGHTLRSRWEIALLRLDTMGRFSRSRQTPQNPSRACWPGLRGVRQVPIQVMRRGCGLRCHRLPLGRLPRPGGRLSSRRAPSFSIHRP